VESYMKWKKGVDPKKRRTDEDRIFKFICLAPRGMAVSPDMLFSDEFCPVYPDQKSIVFKVFATPRPNQRFCDEPYLLTSVNIGMKEIGKLTIELPDVHFKLDRSVEFGLKFGELLITATARNKKTDNVYSTTFQYAKSESHFEPAVN
ncbi:40235_t:CDS:2, partial [Gigaspora margarita]